MQVKPRRLRVIKIQTAMYSIEKPNPEWMIKGERWINFVLSKRNKETIHKVAYIPHEPLETSGGDKIIPKRYDLEENPDAFNFYVDMRYNKFVIEGVFPKADKYIGSPKKVHLFPDRDIDKEDILDLFKLAEKIYDPPE